MESNFKLGNNMTVEKEPGLAIRAGNTTYVIGLHFMFSSSMKYSKRRRKIQHLSTPHMSGTARRTCRGTA